MDVDPSQDQDLVAGYNRAARRGARDRRRPVGTGRLFFAGLILLLAAAAGTALFYEMRTSRLQARHIASFARQCTTAVESGPSPAIHFPAAGPYDERLGYVGLPSFVKRLTGAGFDVAEQTRFSPALLAYTERGFFPAYREKAQAGLSITDRHGQELFSASYPERIYPDFASIPEIAVKALLFIENRELLDAQYPNKNPAVEWERLAAAVLNLAMSLVDRRNVPGGSTLAVQLEKYRHSPQGITGSLHDKFTQMISASVRAYMDGEQTRAARYQIVLDFVNSIPLGAIPGYGEITGLGDGLFAWYGADFEQTNRILADRPASAADPHLKEWAMALKQALSLFIAQRRPSSLLDEDREALAAKTDSHLRLLAAAGIITAWERDAALALKLNILASTPPAEKNSFLERKAANAVRTNLLSLLGVQQFYQLNHFDLSVKSSIDQAVQQEVSAALKQLNDPVHAREAGLNGFRLLENSDPAKVIYSLTLYERTNGANLLRIQTDTFDQPLDINAGIKLELGSSAKLRTLVSYLDVVATLHGRYAGLSPAQLRSAQTEADDNLSRWAIDYLLSTQDKGLRPMLLAAMQRRYSASPAETFFTGGGAHTFVNFDPEQHDHGIYTVQYALENSINLVFIRLMRDIVRYYQHQIPGVSELLSDQDDPRRQEYLARFADQEGTIFQQRFYRKYAGKSFTEAFALLLQGVHPHPARLSAVFRYLRPEASEKEFTAFMAARFTNPVLSAQTVSRLYSQYAPESFSLVDRGYIARIHPLELWTLSYLRSHPNASRSEVLKASNAERQAVYTWLFKTSRKNKQDRRIRDLVEVEAFSEIHAQWKKVRYPFDSLVPSYATAIGSSADRPAALAELVGIIINDGKWYPSSRIQELHFAAGTPYETRLLQQEGAGEQVLAPEVAAVVREAMLGVVASGTAQRVNKAYLRPDGTPMAVGGKTGTGDNRHEIYGSGGRLIESKVINRTAVFVFYLDQRFFGCITAYVAGPPAAGYKFTSALPVQVLKVLAPKLMVLAQQQDGDAVAGPAAPAPSPAPAAPTSPASLPAATPATTTPEGTEKATAMAAKAPATAEPRVLAPSPAAIAAMATKARPAPRPATPTAVTKATAATTKDKGDTARTPTAKATNGKPIFIRGRTEP